MDKNIFENLSISRILLNILLNKLDGETRTNFA